MNATCCSVEERATEAMETMSINDTTQRFATRRDTIRRDATRRDTAMLVRWHVARAKCVFDCA
eukprot:1344925-Lingulodinium_polyedra.AAC.1